MHFEGTAPTASIVTFQTLTPLSLCSRLFLSPHLADSLLILDDVWKPEVIKTFMLPVRILVTTQDVSVMEIVRGHFSIVELR